MTRNSFLFQVNIFLRELLRVLRRWGANGKALAGWAMGRNVKQGVAA
jgi:hypothetical protein